MSWSRFSANAKYAIAVAQQEAQQQGGNQVGSQHILLGVIAKQDAEAVSVLRHLGVAPDTVETSLRPRLPAVPHTHTEPELSRSGKFVVDVARDGADSLDSRTIGTAHPGCGGHPG